MIFDFRLNGKTYEMDLSPELRVAIARHLIDLHKEYCAANPTEDIDLNAYLALVEKSPHPENEPTESPPTTEGDRDEYADETLDDKLIAYGARTESSRRKDLMIDALLEAIAKLR